MAIKIETEKIVWSDGELSRKILSIEGCLEKEHLPKIYMKDGVFVWYTSFDRVLRIEGYNCPNLYVGLTLSEERFQQSLEYIRKAGERLHEVKKKLTEMRKKWNGKETFVI